MWNLRFSPSKYPEHFSERIPDFVKFWWTNQVITYYNKYVQTHDLRNFAKRTWIIEHFIQTIIRNLIVFADRYADFQTVLKEFLTDEQLFQMCGN